VFRILWEWIKAAERKVPNHTKKEGGREGRGSNKNMSKER
jgi:hypothetical protein